jgi:hypothetical protein
MGFERRRGSEQGLGRAAKRGGNGTPARITNGDGFAVKPSITADSKRLVFNRAKPQADVYVSEFFAKSPRLSTPRRLTLDDADDFPFDWTVDNEAVLFISNRTGTDNVFRQRIDETSAEMLTFGPKEKSVCHLSPDGTQILYLVPSKRQFPGGTVDASTYQWGPVPDNIWLAGPYHPATENMWQFQHSPQIAMFGWRKTFEAIQTLHCGQGECDESAACPYSPIEEA